MEVYNASLASSGRQLFKHHLKRAMKNESLSFPMFESLVTRIEPCLNQSCASNALRAHVVMYFNNYTLLSKAKYYEHSHSMLRLYLMLFKTNIFLKKCIILIYISISFLNC